MKKFVFSLILIAGTVTVSAQEAFIEHVTELVIPQVRQSKLSALGFEQVLARSLEAAFNDKEAVFSLLDIQVISGDDSNIIRAGTGNSQSTLTVFSQENFDYYKYVNDLNAEQLKQIKLNLYSGMREINTQIINSIELLDTQLVAHYEQSLLTTLKSRQFTYKQLYNLAVDATPHKVLINDFANELVDSGVGRKIFDLDDVGRTVLKMTNSQQLKQFFKSVLTRVF